MHSFLFPTALNQFRNRPCARLDAWGLSLSHAQRAVLFAEVVISEIERNRSLKVFLPFAEGVREAREASAVHSQRVVLFFNVGSGNAANIGRAAFYF